MGNWRQMKERAGRAIDNAAETKKKQTQTNNTPHN